MKLSVIVENEGIKHISKDGKSYPQIALIMCITSVLVSQIGFSNLINISFPIFGVFGIFQILLIMVNGCKGVKNEKK